MASTTVLIIGCGIAGPVLALLLKKKGYEPIVFEKVNRLGDAGASLMINPNGNKVLSMLDIDKDISKLSPRLEAHRDFTAYGELLGESDVPATFRDRYGYDAVGVKRTALNLLLRDHVLRSGIDVREGWVLDRIDEQSDCVTAYFNGGRSASGSLLIGCDGIKAASRSLILKAKSVVEEEPGYTGLSQTAGISPTPSSLSGQAAMQNWYGDAVHFIAYPVSQTHTSWAITRPTSEHTKETWRLYRPDEVEKVKSGLQEVLNGFQPAVLALVLSAERITKYGLYDRRERDPGDWYSERCVLVGDAAHPTSPHLGQGANQALEDCYHLANLMPAVVYEGGIEPKSLQTIFRAYAESRQPRTSALVRGARAQGEKRVTSGAESCKRRDEAIREGWKDPVATKARYDRLFLGHPF